MVQSNSRRTKVSESLCAFKVQFLFWVAALYLIFWWKMPEKTAAAFQISIVFFSQLLLPFALVFCFMILLNLFLTPPRLEKRTKNGSGAKQTLIAAIAGILSSGPIFAWYPMLKDLRDRGVAPSLIAVFLVNRAVKPALVPMMVSLFGWPFVLLFTCLTLSASFCVGFCMNRLFP
ncbi:hypothetical protein [uncultured Desulfobacter sp.]|uniref:hypothetical protein n=1 Tax=uncultured Desulfobacter sp. TaxID=240139 RepID=UPI0029F46554|nr:hypothetical protein [uncultured Desulfobacter sp.]